MDDFSYITNDYKKVIQDPDIDLVVISTNHNSHAKFIIEALEEGKSVYCEKPLCLSLEELDKIESAYRTSNGNLFCGMNRRFASLMFQIKAELKTNEVPAVYDYIVNAGEIPADHWTQDESIGGGRIIGEACHMVDAIQSLDESPIEDLRLTFADAPGYPCRDNVLITMSMKSGAIANIVYTSMGSKKYPKEQLRVFSAGNVFEMNNYVGLSRYSNTKKSSPKIKQDKGIKREYEYMLEVLCGERKNAVIEDAFVGHRMLLEALEHYRG